MPDSSVETHAAAGPPGVSRVLRVRAVDVEVLTGPDAGRRVRVTEPTFAFGTGEDVDLRLSDPKVSRHHFGLALADEAVRLRDPGSKNGTWLGRVRIHDGLLASDCVVSVGDTTIALRLEAQPTELTLSARESFGGAIGVSPAMRRVFEVLERAAQSEISVLLEGESGVGKDVLAHAVHDASKRRDGPFVAVDCGALPENLFESELFGHEKGAFTGADRASPGLFAQAQDGTLFLDEIGELPPEAQAKLLRVLETREVRAVGAQRARKIDVRLVCATNRRLAEDTQGGAFRKDLYYRIAGVRVTVPALRDRVEDIVPIATALLRSMRGDPRAEVPPDLAHLLVTYPWPGNVRELRNVVERHTVLGARDAQALFDGPGRDGGGEGDADDLSAMPYRDARSVAVDRFERRYLTGVLARAGGVVSRAAELAGVARPSFYRMLQRAGMSLEKD